MVEYEERRAIILTYGDWINLYRFIMQACMDAQYSFPSPNPISLFDIKIRWENLSPVLPFSRGWDIIAREVEEDE